ncbi:hypothetical protein B0H14DRAFT_3467403 [Mycena olivaceomarginata]|nr:hypothetical protein B0H14DRAFT_3467403 [Mycena olivaceomarginata]
MPMAERRSAKRSPSKDGQLLHSRLTNKRAAHLHFFRSSDELKLPGLLNPTLIALPAALADVITGILDPAPVDFEQWVTPVITPAPPVVSTGD